MWQSAHARPFPPNSSDGQRLRRFEQEAHAASALNHPNIITIHEIGRINDRRFLVSEHVEGETLRQRIQREPLSPSGALDMINSFSRLPQLQVIARTTAFRYKGKDSDTKVIGRDLRVDAIIVGKVTLQGDRLIVQADLVNTADGAQILGGEV